MFLHQRPQLSWAAGVPTQAWKPDNRESRQEDGRLQKQAREDVQSLLDRAQRGEEGVVSDLAATPENRRAARLARSQIELKLQHCPSCQDAWLEATLIIDRTKRVTSKETFACVPVATKTFQALAREHGHGVSNP